MKDPTKGAADQPLTRKQERFVAEYLVDACAKQAAIRAGYSPTSARWTGYELLQKPHIKKALAAQQEEISERCGGQAEETVRALGRIAFADVRRLLQEDGTPKAVSELDDDTAAAIQVLEVTTIGGGLVGYRYRLADKNGALDKLMRHLGLYETDNKQRADPIRALLEAIDGGTRGVGG